MKNVFTKYTSVIAIFAIAFMTVLSTADAGKRRIVMEDVTGGNCPWCSVGNEQLENMLEEYGDSFIPVAVHTTYSPYTDAMKWSGSTALGQAIGLTGYPTGALNRKLVTGNVVAHHPNGWPQSCASQINEEAMVDVTITWELNKSTKMVTGTVTAEILEDYNGQLAFNMYVMEDDMTGSGRDWRQTNNASGNASYKGWDIYDMPQIIDPFSHQNVLREMLGTTFGTIGEFPMSVKKGDSYSHDFSFNLTTLNTPVQNMDKLWVVGLVQQKGAGKIEIMNAVMDGKEMPLPKYGVDIAISATDAYNVIEPSNTIQKTITLENNTDTELTASVSLDGTKSVTPTGWSVSFDKTSVTIPANSTTTVVATIMASAKAGHGTFAIQTISEGQDGVFKGKTVSTSINALSSNVKKAIYSVGSNTKPLEASIKSLPELSDAAFIPTSAEASAAYPASMFDVAIFPEDYTTRGLMTGANGASIIATMEGFVAAGKPILITSVLDMFFVKGNGGYTPTAASKSFFNNTLGIDGFSSQNPVLVGDGQSNIAPITIAGTDQDVAKGFTATINQYNAQTHPYYSFWIDNIQILDDKKASPFLKYTGNQYNNAQFAGEAQKVCGVKIETGKGRAIYMGFGFDLFQNMTQRNALLKGALDWLMEGAVDGASIASSTTNIDFGKVLNKEADMQSVIITGKGSTDLVITGADFSGMNASLFTLSSNHTFPITLKYKETVTFDITFDPEMEGNFTSSFDIASNADDMAKLSVSLMGEGSDGDAKLAVAEDFDFEDILVGQSVSKEIIFMSEGDKKVTITGLDMTGDDVENFEINTPHGASFPIEVEPGKELVFNVTFTPDEAKDFEAWFALKSDAVNGDDAYIVLQGTGTASSVYELDSKIIKVSMSQNPIKNNGSVNYTINGTSAHDLKMTLFSSNGEKLDELTNSTVTSGDYSLNLNTNTYSNGAYYILVEIDGKYFTKNFVIAK